jgi:hypothetical protein
MAESKEEQPDGRNSPVLERAAVYAAVFAASAGAGSGPVQKVLIGGAGVLAVGAADFLHWRRSNHQPPR